MSNQAEFFKFLDKNLKEMKNIFNKLETKLEDHIIKESFKSTNQILASNKKSYNQTIVDSFSDLQSNSKKDKTIDRIQDNSLKHKNSLDENLIQTEQFTRRNVKSKNPNINPIVKEESEMKDSKTDKKIIKYNNDKKSFVKINSKINSQTEDNVDNLIGFFKDFTVDEKKIWINQKKKSIASKHQFSKAAEKSIELFHKWIKELKSLDINPTSMRQIYRDGAKDSEKLKIQRTQDKKEQKKSFRMLKSNQETNIYILSNVYLDKNCIDILGINESIIKDKIEYFKNNMNDTTTENVHTKEKGKNLIQNNNSNISIQNANSYIQTLNSTLTSTIIFNPNNNNQFNNDNNHIVSNQSNFTNINNLGNNGNTNPFADYKSNNNIDNTNNISNTLNVVNNDNKMGNVYGNNQVNKNDLSGEFITNVNKNNNLIPTNNIIDRTVKNEITTNYVNLETVKTETVGIRENQNQVINSSYGGQADLLSKLEKYKNYAPNQIDKNNN